MTKEELIKELSLTDDQMESLRTFGLHGEPIHILHVEEIARRTLLKVLSNPKILIKKDDQSLPDVTYLSTDMLTTYESRRAVQFLMKGAGFVATIPFNEMEE